MIYHNNISRLKLLKKVKNGEIVLAGNRNAKPQPIYGTLQCKKGKRLKVTDRVFFLSEDEAKVAGYRPCGSCLHNKYRLWIPR